MTFWNRENMTPFGRDLFDSNMWRREGEMWGDIGQSAVDLFNPFTPLPWDKPYNYAEPRFPTETMIPQGWQGGTREQGGMPAQSAQLPPPPRFIDNSPFDPMAMATMQWQGQQDISAAHTEWKDRAFQQIMYYGRNLPPYMLDDIDMKYNLTVENPLTGNIEPNPDARPEDVQAALQEIMPSFAQFATGSEQGRMQMQQAVEQGVVSPDVFYGKGTPWEAWQHAQAAEFNRVQGSGFDIAGDPTISAHIQAARAAGIDTSGVEAQLAQTNQGRGWGDEELGRVIYPLILQTRDKQQQIQNTLSSTFAKQFPEAFERFNKEIGDPDEADAGRLPAEGFYGWAMQQDWFVKEYQQWETEQWGKYGNIYQAYLQYLGQGGDKTFDEFKQETPEIQAELQLRQEAETARATQRSQTRWESARQQ